MRRSKHQSWSQFLGSAVMTCAAVFGHEARAQTWTNLVSNSEFDSGTTAPWVIKSNSATASFGSIGVSADTYMTLDLVVSDSSLEVTDLEVGQAGIGLVAGHTYRATFYGMADPAVGSAQARVKVGAVAPPYTSYFQADVSIPYLGPSGYGETFQYTFAATSSDPNAWFGVFVGGNTETIELDSLYLEELDTSSGAGGASGGGGAPGTGGVAQGGSGGALSTGTATAIYSNQLGYVPNGPKRATAVTNSTAPLAWQLLDGSGAVVGSGLTEPFGADGASGDSVQVVDFSTIAAAGDGYRLGIGSTMSAPFGMHPDLYSAVQRAALRFFYHQRASSAITAPYAEGAQWERAEGHPDTNMACLTDCGYTLDVPKGWYDAGDHGKYVVNGGIALFTLFDLYERTKTLGTTLSGLGDGTLNIPESGNGVSDLLDDARWEMEFMLEMQVPDSAPLAGMVHHKVHDDEWTPLPTAPASDTTPRHLHPPSTAATLNLAATAAQCARIFTGVDAAFSARCLAVAKSAYAAAVANPAMYAPSTDSIGGGAYDDTDVSDEFYWAAAELYVTTGAATYESAVRASPHLGEIGAAQGPFSWSSVAGLGTLSLAVAGGTVDPDLLVTARTAVVAAGDKYVDAISKSGYGSPIDTYVWGSDSDVLNSGIVLGLAHDVTGDPRYAAGAIATLDHVLGRNALGQSYVTSFGQTVFHNSHHRFFAHGIDPSWPVPPPGVVAGGPNANLDGLSPTDPLQGCRGPKCWRDDATAYSLAEVAINWNAPLAWVAAWVNEFGTNPKTTYPGVDGKGTGTVSDGGNAGSGPADASAAGAGGHSGGGGAGSAGRANGGVASSTLPDGGVAVDASRSVQARSTGNKGGCGCRFAATSTREWSGLLVALLAYATCRQRRASVNRSR